jgi:hypothetical protein
MMRAVREQVKLLKTLIEEIDRQQKSPLPDWASAREKAGRVSANLSKLKKDKVNYFSSGSIFSNS